MQNKKNLHLTFDKLNSKLKLYNYNILTSLASEPYPFL